MHVEIKKPSAARLAQTHFSGIPNQKSSTRVKEVSGCYGSPRHYTRIFNANTSKKSLTDEWAIFADERKYQC